MKPLKFELVYGYGVLVDEKAEIRKGDYVTYQHDGLCITKIINTFESHRTDCNKIIFAEKELNLDVPVFEWRNFDVWQKSESANGYAYYGKPLGEKYLAFKEGFTEGYKSNPAKYTEDDLRKAISMARQYPPEVAGYREDEIIKSLQKHPKYVVMESERIYRTNSDGEKIGFPVHGEKLKLFVNAERKQQGIVKELIWE